MPYSYVGILYIVKLKVGLINFFNKSVKEPLAGTHKMLVRIANREDPEQTASSEVHVVWSGSAMFV